MRIIGLEPTNQCNRACRHCFRNRADPPGFLPLETAAAILAQARDLGFKLVCLTGGEVALYPHLGELLRLIVGLELDFTMVTNGCRFPSYVLPLLLEPDIGARLEAVYFSLDGATAASHDGLRGPKSFREVLEAITLCQHYDLPFSLKSVITTANRGELTDLALLGARLGAVEHGFLAPFPTPDFIRSGLLPSPVETDATITWLLENLVGVTRHRISVEGRALDGVTLNCGHLVDFLNVDYQGNLIFCCTLSHVAQGDGLSSSPGAELLADLKKVPLQEAIVRQYRQAAAVMAARLAQNSTFLDFAATPCLWCLQHFDKLSWLQDFPESPWSSWLLPRP